MTVKIPAEIPTLLPCARVLAFALVLVVPFSSVLAQQSNGSNASPAKTPVVQRSGASMQDSYRILITVVDENGVAVPSARVLFTRPDQKNPIISNTDFAGRSELRLAAGTYSLRVEKPGFYQSNLAELRIGETENVDVTLTHEQEVKETIDVVESPPMIDPTKTETTETLTSREILNIPYPTTRDIRNILPLMPQVVQDSSGRIHVAGSSASQTLNLLDDFNIAPPASGFQDMHVSADSVRTVEAETSRYSPEYGKGNSVIGMNTGMGDDKFRVTATNFLPSVQFNKGLNIEKWVPRATVSGPIKKGKAWFFFAPDVEYDLNIVKELPPGKDRSTFWQFSNVAKFQVNLAPSNILSTEFVVNDYHGNNLGLSQFNPIESTIDRKGSSYLVTIKDQHYFSSGLLLELGLGVINYSGNETPLGVLSFGITPETSVGSFYRTTTGKARRYQFLGNVYLPPVHWHGRHEFKVGSDFDRIALRRTLNRSSIDVIRENGTLSRHIAYAGISQVSENNFEATAYGQDRWFVTDRLLVESGLRLDWDEIVRQALVSPRVVSTYMLGNGGNTKISAGLGLFYSATNLDYTSRPTSGDRIDFFYGPDGRTLAGPPIRTSFVVNNGALKEPNSLNWSVGLEHKLPKEIYLRLDYLQKRGRNGFVFLNTTVPEALLGQFVLGNVRQDRYDAFQVTFRRTFKGVYPFMLSYVRSSARTNALLDLTPDTVVLGQQQGGRLSWDTPNRLLSWGWVPTIKKLTLGYALEWRNGYPLSVVNQDQFLVGPPNSRRLPQFFKLDVALERRFHIAGYYLAIRGTVEDITNNRNIMYVNNNIDSSQFLTSGGIGHRAFSGRIRFLGRSHGKSDSTQKKQTPTPATPQSAP